MNVDVPRSIAYVAGSAGREATGRCAAASSRETCRRGFSPGHARHAQAAHAYEAGVSCAMQQYFGGNGEPWRRCVTAVAT
jgi:hypothetical protein